MPHSSVTYLLPPFPMHFHLNSKSMSSFSILATFVAIVCLLVASDGHTYPADRPTLPHKRQSYICTPWDGHKPLHATGMHAPANGAQKRNTGWLLDTGRLPMSAKLDKYVYVFRAKDSSILSEVMIDPHVPDHRFCVVDNSSIGGDVDHVDLYSTLDQ